MISDSTRASIKGLLIAFSYGAVSVGMAFANKAILTSYGYDHPYFLVLSQMVFTIVLLESLRLSRVIDLKPFTLERGRSFLAPAVFYAIHSVVALSALSGMNIPMYGVIKRCNPVVVLILASVFIKKGFPSCRVLVSVLLITTGCIVAGYGDLAFDLKAYAYGVTSVFAQAIYLILVQKYGKDEGVWGTVQLNSYDTLPILLVSAALNGDLMEGIRHFPLGDVGFTCVFVTVISVGCLLNYLLFLCTTYNSALTTTITGSLKSIVQTAIGLVTFGGISINIFTVSGIMVNICGGIMYAHAKYQTTFETNNEEKHKNNQTPL